MTELPPSSRARNPSPSADLENVQELALDDEDAICMRKPSLGVVCAVPGRTLDPIYAVSVSTTETSFALGPLGICFTNGAKRAIECTRPGLLTAHGGPGEWSRLGALEGRRVEAFSGALAAYCARSDGKMVCQGRERAIALPFEFDVESEPPPIAIAADRTCAVLGPERELRCFSGQNPLRIQRLTNVAAVVAGAGHICALGRDGRVHCLGSNERAQLGHLRAAANENPELVRLPGLAVRLAAGASHTCAVLASGDTYCWGSADEGSATGVANGGQRLETCRLLRIEKSTLSRPCPPRPGASDDAGDVRARPHPSAGPAICRETHENPIFESRVPCVQPNGTDIWVQPGPTRIPGLPKAIAIAAGRARTCIVDDAKRLHCFGGTPLRFPAP